MATKYIAIGMRTANIAFSDFVAFMIFFFFLWSDRPGSSRLKIFFAFVLIIIFFIPGLSNHECDFQYLLISLP